MSEPLLSVGEDGYTFHEPPERWSDEHLIAVLKYLERSIPAEVAAYRVLAAERDRRMPAYAALAEAMEGLFPLSDS